MGAAQSFDLGKDFPTSEVIQHMTFDQLYDFCKDDTNPQSVCRNNEWWKQLIKLHFNRESQSDDPRREYLLGKLDRVTLRELNMFIPPTDVIYGNYEYFYRAPIHNFFNLRKRKLDMQKVGAYVSIPGNGVYYYGEPKTRGLENYINTDTKSYSWIHQYTMKELNEMIAHQPDETIVVYPPADLFFEEEDVIVYALQKMKISKLIPLIKVSSVVEHRVKAGGIYFEFPNIGRKEDVTDVSMLFDDTVKELHDIAFANPHILKDDS